MVQVVLIDDQQPVEKLAAQGADHPFTDSVALGACGGLGRILMPSAVNTASKDDLAAQHRVLVPQDQQFGVLGYLTAGQRHQAAEHASQDQVDDREDHPAMIPVRRPARSSNRAPRDGRESNSAGQSCDKILGTYRAGRALICGR